MLIIIEGNDASGKETQSKLLFEYFRSQKIQSELISFPDYGSESSALVKMYLNGLFGQSADDVNPRAASIFFACDRYASYKTKWEQRYLAGDIIIADRYTTSNAVHQASKLDTISEREEFIDWLFDLEYNIFAIPKPDLVIFLDMPFEVSQKLIRARNNKFSGESDKDIHESDIAYLKKTNSNALQIADKLGWHKIVCVDPVGDLKTVYAIHQEIIDVIEKNYEII